MEVDDIIGETSDLDDLSFYLQNQMSYTQTPVLHICSLLTYLIFTPLNDVRTPLTSRIAKVLVSYYIGQNP